ncbi:hypothetical protein W822_14720 [Advenella kashmirensis W13003]|uniref:Filamentous haemagglutinin FhaB/tRNA nuclease CdiA-like TPS domain-containing protein n=1 Tax=Advenella kashmirensis W13003 TaxID=1424334 RepID=V8QTQ2_9BURK|nr:hemagglutinin repeat-containing protein [Advenella kashmirensis]ETF02389.1 hypothetical protein W822_14720 [Advenella kashmirensis W13003]
MNKRCYRLRFNHVRGQWMAVADIVVGPGKSHAGRSGGAAGSQDQVNARNKWGIAMIPALPRLRLIMQAIVLAGVTGLIAFVPDHTAQAQIVANKAMPTHTQPSIVTTANGLPQVNIQTPNSAGVSMNNYSQFDVQPSGAILNNSRTSTQTQLAGWIQGNPLLTTDSARVIVNQIQSSNPSLLRGYIEVAGQRAQVVMANPAGISCEGCGFIHADRAVLTTGQVGLNPSTGALDNYVVRSGTVNIANMDASQTPYVDVLARAAKVTGTIRAKQLDIKTGINTIDANTGAVCASAGRTEVTAASDASAASDGRGDQPEVAIDIAELGGMYAGQITLLATEHGVGVRNLGNIRAGENLTLSANGQLHNRGTLAADGALNVQADSLLNDGTLYGGQNTAATTVTSLKNNKQILSGGNIALTANGATGSLTLGSESRLAAGLDLSETNQAQPGTSDKSSATTGKDSRSLKDKDSRSLKPGQSISLNAKDQAIVAGTIQVDGSLLAQADTLSVSGSELVAQDIRLTSRQGDLLANKAKIHAHTLAVNTPWQLSTEEAQIQAEALQLNAGSIRNRRGKLIHTGSNPFVLQTGALDNQGGLIATVSANLTIKSDSINNTEGTILQTSAAETSANPDDNALNINRLNINQLSINSGTLTNTRGTIRNNTGAVNLALADNALLTNQAGQIHSGTTLTLRAGGIDNQAGRILAGERLQLQLDKQGQGVDNRRGKIAAQTLDGFNTRTLDNREGRIEVSGETGLWLATTGLLTNEQGIIAVKGSLNIQAGDVDNRQGVVSSQRNARIHSASGLNNDGGKVVSDQTLFVEVDGDLHNQNGNVSAGTDMVLRGDTVNNQAGKLLANGDVALNASTLHNENGRIAAQRLQLRGGAINNDAGLIQAVQEMTIDTDGHQLINTNTGKDKGVISGGTLQLATGKLDNREGFIGAAKAATLQTGTLDNRQGRVGTDDLRIQAKDLDNRQGNLQSVKNIALDLGNASLDTRSGLIRAGDTLHISAATINNDDTFDGDRAAQQQKGIQANTITLAGGTLFNHSGFIAATQNLEFNISDSLNNQSGYITSLGTTRILDPQGNLLVNNEQGYISGKEKTQVQSAQLTGQGGTFAGDHLSLDLRGDYQNAHSLIGHTRLDLSTTGDVYNEGKLESANALAIQAHNLKNTQQGKIQAKHTRLQASDTIRNEGLINGQNTVVVADRIHNLGTGRIYGIRLGLQARELSNGGKQQDDTSRAGTIAARDRLDIGAQTLSNQDGALIYSGGDAAFGRTLDPDGRVTGTASSIVNNGSMIDIAGSAQIKTEQLRNLNADYRTELQQVGPVRKGKDYEPIPEHSSWDPSLHKRYDSDSAVVLTMEKSMLYYEGPDDKLWDFWGKPNALKIGKRYRGGGFPSAYIDDRRVGIAPSYYVSRLDDEDILFPWIIDESKKVYSLVYSPDDPIWEKTGIPAPDRNIPPSTIKVCSGISWNEVCQTKPNPEMKRYIDNNPSYAKLDELISQYNHAIQGYHEDMFREYEYEVTTQETRITHSKPGQISIGKNLALSGGAFTNDKSRVAIGGAMTGTVQFINNIDDENAIRRITERGRHREHDDDDDYGDWHDYEIPREEHIPASVAVVQIGQGAQSQSVDIVPVPDQTAEISAGGAAPVKPGDLVGTGHAIIEVSPDKPLEGTVTGSSEPAPVIRTTTPRRDLPSASLFIIRPDGQGGPLIETDPQFTQYGNWLTSNYMLEQLGLDPQHTLKRLGDGFYERNLINEQIGQLTGRRFLDGYQNDEEQYRALMNNAVTFAKKFDLRPGIALTAEQMAQLTSDIVWLVEQTVTLPDGSQQRVLAPQVYVKVRKGDLRGDGALVSADQIKLQANDTVYNSGTVAGRQLVDITADSIANMAGGRMNADKIALTAKDDIRVVGGQISAEQALNLKAGHDIEVASTLNHIQTRSDQDNYEYTDLDRLAGLYVTGSKGLGQLQVQADRDLILTAAALGNAGQGKDSSTVLQAGNNLALKTLTTRMSELVVSDASNYVKRIGSEEKGTHIASNGDIVMRSGNDLSLRGADVTSQQGAVNLQAGRDVRIEAGLSESGGQLRHKGSKRTGLATKTTEIRSDVQRQTLVGSAVSGETVSIQAGRDLKVVASDVVSDNSTTLIAQNNIRIEAGTENNREHEYRNTTKSGLLGGSGGLGFTVGTQSLTQQTDSQGAIQSQARSSVGSIKGDTRLVAGEQVLVRGSDVLAGDDILIAGKAVTIDPGTDQRQSKHVTEFRQSGLTIGVDAPIIQAVQAGVRATEQAGKSKNARVNAMSLANVGWSGYKIGQQGANVDQAMGQLQAGDAKGAAETAGVKLSITYGSQRSRSSTEVQQTETSGSQVRAQNTVTILATGAGTDSDITVIGSDIAGKKGTTLIADDAITLQAAEQTTRERSKNSSSGGKIGVSIGYENGSAAFGITVGANVGKGKGVGDEICYINTHVGDRDSATLIQSGGATTLKGAQVAGSRVRLKASDLTIESLQDKATFKGKQDDARGEITIGYGASGSGSISRSKISADYAGVNEQSGIFAQDQGYQIDVADHTDLTGAIITSSAAAEQKGLNRLTTGTLDARHIENHSKVKATSVGIGGDGNPMGVFGGSSSGLTASFGYGSFSSNESSVFHSGINTANIAITRPDAQQALTGKTAQDTIASIHTSLTNDEALAIRGLDNTFDKDEVQKQIDLDRDISQQFSKNTQEASGELKKRMARNDADFKAGLISEKERDERNAQLRNLEWLLGTVSAGLATPSNGLAGSLVAAASPTIAREIGQQFKQAGKEGSAGHIFAHAALGALVAGATGNGVAGGALAGAGAETIAPITAKLLFDKDVTQLTPEEKKTVSSIASLTGAGLAGAVGGNGKNLVSGSVVGRTAVENNYLTNAQLENLAQQIRNCSGDQCDKVIREMVDTNIRQQEEIQPFCAASPEQCQTKYGHLLDEMDASIALIKKLDIDKTLSNKFRNYLIAIYMLNSEARGLAVEDGWAKRIEEMGVDKETAQLIAAELPSMFGSPGGRKAGRRKVSVQPEPNKMQIADKDNSVAGKSSIKTPASTALSKQQSNSKLSESERLNLEAFDSFTGGASRLKKGQITMDGQAIKANGEFSKNAMVFDNVPRSKVVKYYKKLAGIEFLPNPQLMTETPDIYGNPGILYTVEKGKITYTLRSGSSSVDKTRAKWTIEISGVRGYPVGERVVNRKKIEMKFR